MNDRRIVREPEWVQWLVTLITVAVVTGLALWVLDLILDAMHRGAQ